MKHSGMTDKHLNTNDENCGISPLETVDYRNRGKN